MTPILLFVLFCLLNVADLVSTAIGLARFGRRERNPLMRVLIERFGIWGLFAIKLLVCMYVGYSIAIHDISLLTLVLADVIFVAVVANNVRVIRRHARTGTAALATPPEA